MTDRLGSRQSSLAAFGNWTDSRPTAEVASCQVRAVTCSPGGTTLHPRSLHHCREPITTEALKGASDSLLPLSFALPTAAMQRIRPFVAGRWTHVSATFRSFKRRGDCGTDARSQGTADVVASPARCEHVPDGSSIAADATGVRRPIECLLLTASNSRTRPGAVVRDPELPLPKQPFAPCSRSSSNTPSSSRDIHGDSSVEEQGGLPRSSTSQNQRRNEPPQPCRSAYRASGSVPWPTADHPNDCLPSVGDLQLMKLLAGLMSVANAIGSEWAAHQRRLTLASFGVLHRRSSSRSRPAPAVPRHLPSALPTVRSPHAVRRP